MKRRRPKMTIRFTAPDGREISPEILRAATADPKVIAELVKLLVEATRRGEVSIELFGSEPRKEEDCG